MSRSFKKTPITGNARFSEKDDKKKWHRAFRKKSKDLIHHSHFDVDELENTIFPIEEDVSNPCTMSKDGKHYVDPSGVPKNPLLNMIEVFKKIMRK